MVLKGKGLSADLRDGDTTEAYRPIVRGYALTAAIYYLLIFSTHSSLKSEMNVRLAGATLVSSVLLAGIWIAIRRSHSRLAHEMATAAINMIVLGNIYARISLDYQTVQLGYLPAFAMGAAIISEGRWVLYLNAALVVAAALAVTRPADLSDFAYVLGGGVISSVVLHGLMRGAMRKQVVERIKAERLGAQLAAAVVENKALADQAIAANAAKTDFLSNMSHELRTPLTSIIGYSDFLRGSDALPASCQEHVDRIKVAGNILLSTVNDILDFTRIGSGEVELELLPNDALVLTAEVVGINALQARAKNIALEQVVVHAPPSNLMLDALRFRQILMNLVSNAIKFTPEGRVEVSVDYDADAATLTCAVSDTGIGIPPDRMHKLFKRFSQVDASTTRKFGGTGLGLAICKGLVEQMGGEIRADSVPGKGSRFEFSLPVVVSNDTPTFADGRSLPADCLRYARILVVDDDVEIRNLVRLILEGHGADVALAADGEQALGGCRFARFDLIVTDLHMPSFGGADLVRTLRSGGTANGDIPVIAMSADSRGREAGLFAGFLLKPITPATLVTMAQTLLEAGPPEIYSGATHAAQGDLS